MAPDFLRHLCLCCHSATPGQQDRRRLSRQRVVDGRGLIRRRVMGANHGYAPDSSVEALASLIFLPTMICLVIAMIKFWCRRASLNRTEYWLVLAPISLIAGWCSIAVFVGLNGLIWKIVEPMGWSITGTALSVLGLALWFAIYVLRQKAMNKIYAFPILWGLGFLTLRHFDQDGNIWIGSAALIGVIAVGLAASLPGKAQT